MSSLGGGGHGGGRGVNDPVAKVDLLDVSNECRSVICCRCRPDQKKMMVSLIRHGIPSSRTLGGYSCYLGRLLWKLTLASPIAAVVVGFVGAVLTGEFVPVLHVRVVRLTGASCCVVLCPLVRCSDR